MTTGSQLLTLSTLLAFLCLIFRLADVNSVPHTPNFKENKTWSD